MLPRDRRVSLRKRTTNRKKSRSRSCFRSISKENVFNKYWVSYVRQIYFSNIDFEKSRRILELFNRWLETLEEITGRHSKRPMSGKNIGEKRTKNSKEYSHRSHEKRTILDKEGWEFLKHKTLLWHILVNCGIVLQQRK